MASAHPTARRIRKWLLPVVAPLLGVALGLAGLVLLGRRTLDGLREQDRYTVAFADIDCPPPVPLSREDFLGEVQYLAGLPDRVHLLEDGLATNLARAFALHPLVEKVRRVEVTSARQLRVRLAYRAPVLAVQPPGEDKRAVDRFGVLLPVVAGGPRLPVLLQEVAPPSGQPGTPWGDARVEAAAAVLGLLQPHQDRLRLGDCKAQVNQGEVVLSLGGVRVLWGHPPGKEEAGEATAGVKVQRLLDYLGHHGDLSGPNGVREHDLRPAEQAVLRSEGTGR